MSRKDSKGNVERTFDTKYSSGDSKRMTQKPKQQFTEENNNEIDELSKEFADMGCIVGSAKRPNVCVENCVYQGSESENEDLHGDDNDEDGYSDAFEEDSDGYGEEKVQDERDAKQDLLEMEMSLRAVHSEENRIKPEESCLKLSKSQSFVSKVSRCETSYSKYGSQCPVPQTRRINMSFTNDRLREIERHNHILLEKILCARNSRKSSIPARQQDDSTKHVPPSASAALQRKRQQRQIDHDNMILLRKIQHAKSSACSLRR